MTAGWEPCPQVRYLPAGENSLCFFLCRSRKVVLCAVQHTVSNKHSHVLASLGRSLAHQFLALLIEFFFFFFFNLVFLLGKSVFDTERMQWVDEPQPSALPWLFTSWTSKARCEFNTVTPFWDSDLSFFGFLSESTAASADAAHSVHVQYVYWTWELGTPMFCNLFLMTYPWLQMGRGDSKSRS